MYSTNREFQGYGLCGPYSVVHNPADGSRLSEMPKMKGDDRTVADYAKAVVDRAVELGLKHDLGRFDLAAVLGPED